VHARYRSRTEIISQILDAANGGCSSKTKIMSRALLSYKQVMGYVKFLTEKDLLEYNKETQTFKTTEKGLRFLHLYSEIGDMIEKLPSLASQQQQQKVWT